MNYSARDEELQLWEKLVKLAGGDSGIVLEVLQQPRNIVPLSRVIEEIEHLRQQKEHHASTGNRSRKN